MQDILQTITDALEIPFSYFSSSKKRLYIPYLITSLLLAGFVYFKSKQKGSFINYIFKKHVWIGQSPFVDYSFIFFNSLVKVIVLAPLIGYTVYLAENLSLSLNNLFGTSPLVNWSMTQLVLLYTIAIVIIDDFASYFIHYLMHKVPFLWEFHKIHHAATVMNPLTQYRIHPVELIINNLRSIFIKGLITGVFMYLAQGEISLFTFIGVNVLNFLFFFFGANLRHSHVKLSYFNFLENILISPYQHQIHHSNDPKWYDTNMGSRLAIWDYLFGTLVKSDAAKNIQFGLGKEDPQYNSFSKNLLTPFKNTLKRIK